MTFKNKHSFISGFLGAALLIASSCALGGCTEIADEPQGIDDAGNGTPLTIRATASGFVSCVQGDTPATRTPTENGYTTEFNDGDAIGIFALKEYATPDVTPVDGVYQPQAGLHQSRGRLGKLGARLWRHARAVQLRRPGLRSLLSLPGRNHYQTRHRDGNFQRPGSQRQAATRRRSVHPRRLYRQRPNGSLCPACDRPYGCQQEGADASVRTSACVAGIQTERRFSTLRITRRWF